MLYFCSRGGKQVEYSYSSSFISFPSTIAQLYTFYSLTLVQLELLVASWAAHKAMAPGNAFRFILQLRRESFCPLNTEKPHRVRADASQRLAVTSQLQDLCSTAATYRLGCSKVSATRCAKHYGMACSKNGGHSARFFCRIWTSFPPGV